ADHRAAAADGAQSERDELTDGGEEDRRVEFLGRRRPRVRRPRTAEFPRKGLPGVVAGTGEREDLPALVHGHLGEDVGGSAKAVQTQALRATAAAAARLRHPVGAEADQARTEERGGMAVVERLR